MDLPDLFGLCGGLCFLAAAAAWFAPISTRGEHLGILGFVVGAVGTFLGAILASPDPRRPSLAWFGLAAVLLLLVAVVAMRLRGDSQLFGGATRLATPRTRFVMGAIHLAAGILTVGLALGFIPPTTTIG